MNFTGNSSMRLRAAANAQNGGNQLIEYELWKEHRAKMIELAEKRDRLQREHDKKAVCRKCGKPFEIHLSNL